MHPKINWLAIKYLTNRRPAVVSEQSYIKLDISIRKTYIVYDYVSYPFFIATVKICIFCNL